MNVDSKADIIWSWKNLMINVVYTKISDLIADIVVFADLSRAQDIFGD